MRGELPRRVNVLSIVFAIVAAILLFATASADGKYFPQNAYKVPPAIPTQRTILVYRDGIETLIIESALEGPGQEFGWVIPLPSRPTRFEEASPGNYTLHEDDRGIVWSIYSIEGYPDEYVLTSPPPWEPTDEADAGAPGSG